MTRLAAHIGIILIALWQVFGGVVLANDGGTAPAFEGFPGRPSKYRMQTDSPYCTIPFTRAGNLIVIKATVDTIEGNFILDTGAPGLVLNHTYFRDYPQRHVADAEENGITGSTNGSYHTDVNSFILGTFRYSGIEADLGNLGHIENSRNIRILGLVGLEFFKQCSMIIDFEAGVIHLQYQEPKMFTAVHQLLEDTARYRIIPIDLMDNRIVTTTELGGKKLKMIIDCASETNILNSRLPNRLLEYVSISRKVKLTGAGSRPADALYGSLSELTIGDEPIGQLPVLITNLENTCFSYNGCIDGVLGFDFLSLQKIGFNFVKRKMYIWK